MEVVTYVGFFGQWVTPINHRHHDKEMSANQEQDLPIAGKLELLKGSATGNGNTDTHLQAPLGTCTNPVLS